jgi:hypothetical protein
LVWLAVVFALSAQPQTTDDLPKSAPASMDMASETPGPQVELPHDDLLPAIGIHQPDPGSIASANAVPSVASDKGYPVTGFPEIPLPDAMRDRAGPGANLAPSTNPGARIGESSANLGPNGGASSASKGPLNEIILGPLFNVLDTPAARGSRTTGPTSTSDEVEHMARLNGSIEPFSRR